MGATPAQLGGRFAGFGAKGRRGVGAEKGESERGMGKAKGEWGRRKGKREWARSSLSILFACSAVSRGMPARRAARRLKQAPSTPPARANCERGLSKGEPQCSA